MPIYELKTDSIVPVPTTTFWGQGLKERDDLQRLLRANLEVVDLIRRILREQKDAGKLECLGRGPAARWRRI